MCHIQYTWHLALIFGTLALYTKIFGTSLPRMCAIFSIIDIWHFASQNVCHIQYIWNLALRCPECCAIFSVILQNIKSSEYVTFLPPIMGVTFFSHIATITFFGCHQKNVRLDSREAPGWIDFNLNIVGRKYVIWICQILLPRHLHKSRSLERVFNRSL